MVRFRLRVVGAIVSGLLVIVAAVVFVGQGKDADKRAVVLGSFVALLTAVVGAVRFAISHGGPFVGGQLDDALAALDSEVAQEMEQEASRRQVSPIAIQVAWRRSSHAPRAAVSDLRHQKGDLTIVDVPGGTKLRSKGTIDEFMEHFDSLSFGRLVIIGAAGSGKSSALIRLALMLHGARSSGPEASAPVPVMIPATGWNSTRQSLDDWAANYINDRFLVRTQYRRAGKAIVRSRRIVLLLDGLDEMSPAMQSDALARIADAETLRVVLTSRPAEYALAVLNGHLPRADVVELLDVSPDEARRYLLAGHGTSRRQLWIRFARQLVLAPTTPAAVALRSPLNLSLVKANYANDGDPAELLSATQFPTPDIVRQHLLAALLFSSFKGLPQATLEQYRGWLHFIAQAMNDKELGRRVLSWWRIRTWCVPLAAPILASLLYGATAYVAISLLHRQEAAIAAAVTWAISGALSGALVTSLTPRFYLGSVRGWIPRLVVASTLGTTGLGIAMTAQLAQGNLRDLRLVVVLTLIVGVAQGTAGAVVALRQTPLVGVLRLPRGVDFGIAAIAGGVGGGGVVLLAGWPAGMSVTAIGFVGAVLVLMIVRPSPVSAQHLTPRISFLQDLRGGAIFAAFGGIAIGLAIYVPLVLLTHPPANAGLVGISSGIGCGLSAFVMSSQGVALLLSAAVLRLSGNLPFRLLYFLDTCVKHGVLRQIGTDYQFRHGDLQDYFAHG